MARGGASKVLCLLADGFAERGWEVNLVFLRVQKAYQVNKKVNVISLCQPDSDPPKVCQISIIHNYLRKTPCDVVISFLIEVNMITLTSYWGARKPVIIIQECNDPKLASSKPLFAASKIIYGLADYVVFQTNRVKNYYSKSIQEKSSVIYNPVDIEVQQENITDSKKIVSVGRLIEQKNHLLLLSAFHCFLESHADYTLHIYGDGKLQSIIDTRINDLGLKNKVFLEGNQEHVQKRIVDAEMFVLSSNHEGLSNALLEAMGIGIPCISTDCAGSDEIIEDHVNGILVPVGDKKSLYRAMCELADNRSLRESIQVESHKIKAVIDKDIIIKKWIDIVEQLLSKE